MTAAEAGSVRRAEWRAVELAWEAYLAGTIPVGAVIVDGAGQLVAEGRNRVFDDVAPPGRLVGTRLAHAEIDVLSQLTADRRYADLTVVTSLEPCPLCLAATRMSTVDHVRFLGSDHYAGAISTRVFRRSAEGTAAGTPSVTVDFGRHAVQVIGPCDDRLGLLCGVLRLARLLGDPQDGPVMAFHRRVWPEVVDVAERVLGAGLQHVADAGGDVADVLALLESADVDGRW